MPLPTPDNKAGDAILNRTIALPAFLFPYLYGAIAGLGNDYVWEEVGDMTVEELTAVFLLALDDMIP